MPAIAPTLMTGLGQRTLVETTLGASGNPITYKPGTGQVLLLRNPTGGSLSPVIDGNGGTNVNIDGYGSLSVASGYAVGAIAAGSARAIPLDTIRFFLEGTIDITGGTGIVASLLEFL